MIEPSGREEDLGNWQRPGLWWRWQASASYATSFIPRAWAAHRMLASRFDGRPVVLDRHGQPRPQRDTDQTDAVPAPDRASVAGERGPTLSQRAARAAVRMLGMALAVTVLVALAVPEVRGTVMLLITLAVVGAAAVALARRYHGLAWARRAWHRQQQRARARSAARARRARQAANRQRNAADRASRDADAAQARQQRRQANRDRHWSDRRPTPPDPLMVGERDSASGGARVDGGAGASAPPARARARDNDEEEP